MVVPSEVSAVAEGRATQSPPPPTTDAQDVATLARFFKGFEDYANLTPELEVAVEAWQQGKRAYVAASQEVRQEAARTQYAKATNELCIIRGILGRMEPLLPAYYAARRLQQYCEGKTSPMSCMDLRRGS